MIINKIETNIKKKLYLLESTVTSTTTSSLPQSNVIKVDPNIEYQSFIGFGGAFTESTGYCLSKVDENIYNRILDEYFSEDGLRYCFGRLPIASCDFSLDSYSYSYKNDLSDFSIDRDLQYIIPTIKDALKRNPSIRFISSPWSPPAFMKDNNKLFWGGKLKDEYKKTWANYLVKYINSYKDNGININYMTIQNEPNVSQPWESCRYSAEEEANILINYLHPTFREHGINTQFLVWDHNKDDIVERVNDCFIKYKAINYVAGIAFHWYTGSYFENLNTISKQFPNKLLIHTEGCTGYSKFKPKHELNNAELYAREIIGDLNNGVNAFVDWNLVLDYKGGPNHKKNYCNSPIMLTKHNDNYIKTPVFYYIAQFSKYIKQNAKRINISNLPEDLQATAFKNNDGSIVIVILNENKYDIELNLLINNIIINEKLDANSIVTFVINNKSNGV